MEAPVVSSKELLKPPIEIIETCNLHSFEQGVAQVWHMSHKELPLLFHLGASIWGK